MTKPAADARKKAMDLLARREHARHELVARLTGAGVDPAAAESAVDELAAEGLQDDQRFLESFIQSRIRQGKGPQRIRAELGQKGVEANRIDAALNDAAEDWSALARRVRERKFGAARPGDFREKARQMRFLEYRGFESDHIRRAVGGDDD